MALCNGWLFCSIYVEGAEVEAVARECSTGVGRREGIREEGGSEVRGEVKESVLAGDDGDSWGDTPEYI